MVPRAFGYSRAQSLQEAVALLGELGPESKLLAGGQSLIPLLKLRFAAPSHLVDLTFIPGLDRIQRDGDKIRMGALARHAAIAESDVVSAVPILRDCATGIADVQVRNQGTLGGSLAEADPSGDWAPVLLTLATEVRTLGPHGRQTIALENLITDAYTTLLGHDELIEEVVVTVPPAGSGGAYLAFKRCAPVYASASVAVQLAMRGADCTQARIALGAVGLTAIRASEAESALEGKPVSAKTIKAAAEAAMAAAEPQSDMRGTADYKRVLVGALVECAVDAAVRRARGENVEVSHLYA